jgi:hypothetical protein
MSAFDPWKFWPLLKEGLSLAVAAAIALRTWIMVRQAYSWPSAQGTVWQAEAREAEGRVYVRPWVGELTYSYAVNGEYYSGIHRMEAFTEKRAEGRVAGWKGRAVVVRYSPSKHEVSVLLRGDQPGGQLGN